MWMEWQPMLQLVSPLWLTQLRVCRWTWQTRLQNTRNRNRSLGLDQNESRSQSNSESESTYRPMKRRWQLTFCTLKKRLNLMVQ